MTDSEKPKKLELSKVSVKKLMRRDFESWSDYDDACWKLVRLGWTCEVSAHESWPYEYAIFVREYWS